MLNLLVHRAAERFNFVSSFSMPLNSIKANPTELIQFSRQCYRF